MVLNHQLGIFSTYGSFCKNGIRKLNSEKRMANERTEKTTTLVMLLPMMLRQLFLSSLLEPNSAYASSACFIFGDIRFSNPL